MSGATFDALAVHFLDPTPGADTHAPARNVPADRADGNGQAAARCVRAMLMRRDVERTIRHAANVIGALDDHDAALVEGDLAAADAAYTRALEHVEALRDTEGA